MPTLSNGGQQPPREPGKTLNELLDSDVRKAIDQVEAVDLGEAPDPNKERRKNLGDNLLIGLVVSAFFFGFGVWWDSSTKVGAEPLDTPEVNIGVDPNN